MRFDLIGKMMNVYDSAFDAYGGKPIQTMVDQRSSVDLDERLGQRVRERAHAPSLPGSQNHRRLRHPHARTPPVQR
jgi:hypothetical protein